MEEIIKKLEKHDVRFEIIEKHLVDHDKRFDAVDKRFDAVDKRFDKVEERLDNLEEGLDVVAHKVMDMEQSMGKGFEEIKKGQEKILAVFDKYESSQNKIEREQAAQAVAIARHDKDIVTLKQKVGIA